MRAANESGHGPWYHNEMVWLVIAIPALTVAGCLLAIYLAIANPDELVTEPDAASEIAQPADR